DESGRGSHIRFSAVPFGAVGRRGVRSASRLRQCGEPAVGPRHGTAKGTRGAPRTRREPVADYATVTGGKRVNGPARRTGGSATRQLGKRTHAADHPAVHRPAHTGNKAHED